MVSFSHRASISLRNNDVYVCSSCRAVGEWSSSSVVSSAKSAPHEKLSAALPIPTTLKGQQQCVSHVHVWCVCVMRTDSAYLILQLYYTLIHHCVQPIRCTYPYDTKRLTTVADRGVVCKRWAVTRFFFYHDILPSTASNCSLKAPNGRNTL